MHIALFKGEGAFQMDNRDSFARSTARRAHHAAAELRGELESLLERIGAIEAKTVGIAKLGRCALCGEPTRNRYCLAHSWMEDDDK